MPSKSLLLSVSALTAAVALVPAVPVAVAAPAAVSAPTKSAKSINQMSMKQLRTLTPRVPVKVQRARIDPSGGYQGQRSCRAGNRPGTRALKRLLHFTYSRSIPIGMSRHCGGDTSEHYDGRAVDWMTNSANPRQAAQGDAFVNFLTKKREGVRGAMARRLGVMYIIWRGRMWRAYDPGWRNYNGCANGGGDPTSCHRNHVHISLTWQGANKKTSWYRAR